MAYELRDNSGSLFKNKRKTEETHPDSNGTVMVAGVVYFIDGWTKTTKDGDKWVSLRFKRKDKQGSAPAPNKPEAEFPAAADLDLDHPF